MTVVKARKLGYKAQRELAELPARIEALEEDQARQLSLTAAPDFYRQDQAQVARELERLQALEVELAAAYSRWEELEAQAAGKS